MLLKCVLYLGENVHYVWKDILNKKHQEEQTKKKKINGEAKNMRKHEEALLVLKELYEQMKKVYKSLVTFLDVAFE
jgi:hypothetical protein